LGAACHHVGSDLEHGRRRSARPGYRRADRHLSIPRREWFKLGTMGVVEDSTSSVTTGSAPTAGPVSWRRPPAIARYVVALSSVAVSLIALSWMNVVFQTAAHVSLFLCAVMFSAWFGGFGPGVIAVGASMLAFDYFYLAPVHSFAVQPGQLPRLLLFSLPALFVVSLTAAQRRAAASLTQAHDALQLRSRELEEINRALHAENTERARAQYLTEQMFEKSWPSRGIAIIGKDYRFLQVNKGYEYLSGMSAHRIIGQYYPDVLGAHIFELSRPHLDRCFAGEEVRFEGGSLCATAGDSWRGPAHHCGRPRGRSRRRS
jgi:hypothetical protein